MAQTKDFLEIRVHNSYGDTFERTLEEPCCSEVVAEFVSIAQQLGYPLGSIYEALLSESESVKHTIQAAYAHIKEIENKQ